MKSQSRMMFHRRLLAAVAVVLISATASAQSGNAQDPASPGQLEVAADPPAGQVQTAPVNQLPPQIGQPYWSSVGGFEADTHDTGFGFFGPQYVRPFAPNTSLVGSANVNYLYYDYETALGHTNVRSPGVTTMGGVMFGNRNWLLLQAGPTFKRQHVEVLDPSDSIISSSSRMRVGFNLAASAWYDPTPHNNVFGMYNYDAVDKYNWGRLAFKEQVGNMNYAGKVTPFVGVEYIGQGNQDIRSQQAGAFIEIAHAPSSISIMLRGGYKRSTYQVGPAKTGPWFAVGFYQRLR